MGLVAIALCSLVWSVAHAASPPGTLTAVLEAQSGLMKDCGPLNPHGYRPNEFIIQNMIYEGLVHYGPGGRIMPALAESWETKELPNKEMAIDFKLRRGVTFHDGAPWNAQACLINFLNMFPKPLRDPDYHCWYDLPCKIKEYQVLDEYTFRLVLDSWYYPVLQDLTFIRPVRFISPNHIPNAQGTYSCRREWNDGDKLKNLTDFKCVGTTGVAGTGPWVFIKKVTTSRVIDDKLVSLPEGKLAADEKLKEIVLKRNPNHWARAPGNLDTVVVKLFERADDTMAALLAGDVDMIFGLQTINPLAFKELRSKEGDQFLTYVSEPLVTRIILLNSAKPPTNSLAVRKAIVHAIHKQQLVDNQLAGIEQIALRLFPTNLPYAKVDLWPQLGFDPEKARMVLQQAGWVAAPGSPTGMLTKGNQSLTVEFMFKPDASVQASLQPTISQNLQDLGFNVVPKTVEHDEWNANATAGNFNLAFSETYGPPYDPNSYTGYWRQWAPFKIAQSGMSGQELTEGYKLRHPATQAQFYDKITKVLVSQSEPEKQQLWAEILTAVHEQALFVPLSYAVNVAAVSNRYSNFKFGTQLFDLPMDQLVDNQAVAAVEAQLVERTQEAESSKKLAAGAIAGIVISAIVAALAIGFVALLVGRERRGNPMFVPLNQQPSSEDGEGPVIKV